MVFLSPNSPLPSAAPHVAFPIRQTPGTLFSLGLTKVLKHGCICGHLQRGRYSVGRKSLFFKHLSLRPCLVDQLWGGGRGAYLLPPPTSPSSSSFPPLGRCPPDFEDWRSLGKQSGRVGTSQGNSDLVALFLFSQQPLKRGRLRGFNSTNPCPSVTRMTLAPCQPQSGGAGQEGPSVGWKPSSQIAQL